MKKNTTIFNAIICLVFILNNSYSQTKIDLSKTSSFAKEVFLNCSEYTSSDHLKLYKKNLAQIEIFSINNQNELQFHFELLSSISLKNKCNHSLIHDNEKNFNINNFNPLKYHFNFQSTKDQYYKIDNTNYFIKIKSAK